MSNRPKATPRSERGLKAAEAAMQAAQRRAASKGVRITVNPTGATAGKDRIPDGADRQDTSSPYRRVIPSPTITREMPTVGSLTEKQRQQYIESASSATEQDGSSSDQMQVPANEEDIELVSDPKEGARVGVFSGLSTSLPPLPVPPVVNEVFVKETWVAPTKETVESKQSSDADTDNDTDSTQLGVQNSDAVADEEPSFETAVRSEGNEQGSVQNQVVVEQIQAETQSEPNGEEANQDPIHADEVQLVEQPTSDDVGCSVSPRPIAALPAPPWTAEDVPTHGGIATAVDVVEDSDEVLAHSDSRAIKVVENSVGDGDEPVTTETASVSPQSDSITETDTGESDLDEATKTVHEPSVVVDDENAATEPAAAHAQESDIAPLQLPLPPVVTGSLFRPATADVTGEATVAVERIDVENDVLLDTDTDTDIGTDATDEPCSLGDVGDVAERDDGSGQIDDGEDDEHVERSDDERANAEPSNIVEQGSDKAARNELKSITSGEQTAPEPDRELDRESVAETLPDVTDRPWSAMYPPGVPSTYDYPAVSLSRLIDDAAADFPEYAAVSMMGNEVSYKQIREQADSIATAMIDLGIDRSERVAVVLGWLPQTLLMLAACWRIGAEPVLIDPSDDTETIVSKIECTNPVLVVLRNDTYEAFAVHRSRMQTVRHVFTTGVLDALPRFRAQVAAARLGIPRVNLPNDAGIVDLRGLIDRNKTRTQSRETWLGIDANTVAITIVGNEAVQSWTHRQAVAAAFQSRLWLSDCTSGGEVFAVGGRIDDATLFGTVVTAAMLAAATLALPEPTAEDGGVAKTVDVSRATVAFANDPELRAMFSEAHRQRDLSTLRAVLAIAPPDETVRQIAQERTSGVLRWGISAETAVGIVAAEPLVSTPTVTVRMLPMTDTDAVNVEDSVWYQGPQFAESGWFPGSPGNVTEFGIEL